MGFKFAAMLLFIIEQFSSKVKHFLVLILGVFLQVAVLAQSKGENLLPPIISGAGVKNLVSADSSVKPSILREWIPTWRENLDCRREPLEIGDCIANTQEPFLSLRSGFQGSESREWNRHNFQEIAIQSPFYSELQSPYGSGGLMARNFQSSIYRVDPARIEEVWVPLSPLDTPTTQIKWNRGAFGLNLFDLQFQRMLTTKAYLSLDYTTYKAEEAENFDYLFQTHQPYLGSLLGLEKLIPALDRDSNDIVIKGNFPKIQASHLRPRIGYLIDSTHTFEVYIDHYKNSSQSFFKIPVTDSSDDYQEDFQVNRPERFNRLSLGAQYAGVFPYGEILAQYHLSQYTRLYTPDSTVKIFQNPLWEGYRNHLQVSGKWGIPQFYYGFVFKGSYDVLQAPAFLTVENRSQYLIALNKTHSHEEDIQELMGQYSFSWQNNNLSLQSFSEAGMKRFSLYSNERTYFPQWGSRFNLKWYGLGLNIYGNQNQVEAPYTQRVIFQPIAGFYPSPEVQTYTEANYHGELSYQLRKVELGGYIHQLSLDDYGLPILLPSPERNRVQDTLALKRIPYQENRLNAGFHFTFNLGNWNFGLNHQYLLVSELSSKHPLADSLNSNPYLPSQILAGSIHWQRKLVNNRLHLAVGTTWNWIDDRWDWGITQNGEAKSIFLREFIMGNFYTKMQIKTFSLIYEIRNFAHDRYHLEAGSHPPGVQFRYGILWHFDG